MPEPDGVGLGELGHEQGLLASAGVEEQRVARLEDAREVEEVRVLPEAVVHVAVSPGRPFRGEDDEAVGEAPGEGPAVGAVHAAKVLG